MKESRLISVIVPCYNVEKYVENTIFCILNQTYKNIEIIAVEDCSTDNTYNILQNIQKKYPNKIKLFKNNRNGGLAYTRNKGLEYANGEYIGYIDSDDYIDSNYFEELLNAMDRVGADLAFADIVLVDEDGNNIGETPKACIGKISKENVISNGMAASSCNKLFKRELIEKYPFLEGKINEDVSAIIPAIINAKKLAYANEVKYYYVQRNLSIQNSKFTSKRYDIFEAVKVCLERIKECENYEKYREIIIYHQILMLYIYVVIEQDGFKNRYELIKEFIKRQKNFKIYDIKLFKTFLNTKRKVDRMYYSLLVHLIKYKASFLINIIISIRKGVTRLFKKYLKENIKKMLKITVIRQDLTIKDLKRVAKKQKKMKEKDIKISVVVPNYNYEKFMVQRIYSILAQTEKIYELIILDDCSTDGSRKLIDEIVEEISPYINVKKIYNKENTGIAFKQWAKGFKLAKGDYVWIAEADDCCKRTLLTNLLKPIINNKDKSIYLSYSDTAFINTWAKIFLPSIKPEIDLMKTGHWNRDFIDDGEEEVKNYAFLNCTIANVSSCIIKNDNYDDVFDKIKEYRQAGDWLFYVNVIKRGYIAYCNKPLNFYRVHGDNITSTMKKQEHLEEIKKIHKEIKEAFNLNEWHDKEMQKRYEFLIKVWKLDKTENEKSL